MEVELVEAWVVAVMSELDLELQLVLLTGRPQTVQGAPTPGPPHVRSGGLEGSFPDWLTSRAFPRRICSSGMGVSEHSNGPCVSRE